MFKLFKRFRAIDWLIVLAIVGFVVAQVYCDVTMPDYSKKIFEQIGLGATTGEILGTGGIMLAYAAGSMLATFVVGYLATYLATKFSARLRRMLFSKVHSFSMAEINKFSTPSLITRSTNDVQQVQMAVMMLFRMAIAAPITAIWGISKISASSSELTLASGAWIVFLIAFLAFAICLALPKFKSIQKLTDKLNGVTRENLTGLRVVKAYNADEYEQKKFEKVNRDVTKTNLFVNRIMGFMFPIMFFVMNGISLTIYWFGSGLINAGTLNYGSMMAFSMLVMQILMAFMMLTMMFVIIPRAAVAARRINEVLDTELTVVDPERPQRLVTQGEVEFKNVGFKYPDASDYVLHDISFKVNKGETAAIIGSTGSGKSTLINLVPRFFDVTEGEVLVDGVNVRNVKQEDLRAKLGYVPQKGVLFSGTVKENIAFGGRQIPDADMQAAAQAAMADEFVQNMSDKYDSEIAQSGRNVSGGQRQRLSISRAAAGKPEIYIFDDSFSALDYKTDKTVRANLKKYTEGATNLIVAQRIGTIMDADKIIVLEQGRMVGQGTHKELLKTCGVYKEIALSQLSAAELGIA
ncbi:multidrug ABC transporter ATP-binding protein [Clostridia bacterium]|nr:multidrug ABC transporter ATP-binding protein [Clostridia bacterium]